MDHRVTAPLRERGRNKVPRPFGWSRRSARRGAGRRSGSAELRRSADRTGRRTRARTPDFGETAFENFDEAGRTAEATAFRAWTEPQSGAGLVLFLIDTGDPLTVADGVEGFVTGFTESSQRNGFVLGDLQRSRPGVDGATSTGAGLTQRLAATSSGRVAIALTAVASADFDAADEEAFLFEQLDRQLARVPDTCLDAAPDDDASGSAYAVGAAAAIAMFLVGLPSLIAWLSDGSTRRKDHSPAASRTGVRWIDLAASAQRRAREDRAGQILILISLGVSLISTYAFIERQPAFLLAIPIGLLIASAGRMLLRHRDPHGAIPQRWWRRGRRRWLGAILLVASYVALAVGLMGTARQIHIATQSENEVEVAAILADMDPGLYRNIGLIFALFGFVVAGALYRLARWVVRRSADQARASDPRPPVIVLRPFRDDHLKIRVPTDQFGLTSLLHFRRRERLEEFISWHLANYGPVTTVADPDRRRTPIGAARERMAHDEWMPIVRERIEAAGLIAVVVGATEHLRIELEMIRELDRLGDVIFVIPPTGDAAERWKAVARTLGVYGTLPDEDRRTVVVVVRGGVVHAFHGMTRNAAAYETALHEAAMLISSTIKPEGPVRSKWSPAPFDDVVR